MSEVALYPVLPHEDEEVIWGGCLRASSSAPMFILLAERRGNAFRRVHGLIAKARIWPGLSYVCHIRSTAGVGSVSAPCSSVPFFEGEMKRPLKLT
jgi:hypothetical protein